MGNDLRDTYITKRNTSEHCSTVIGEAVCPLCRATILVVNDRGLVGYCDSDYFYNHKARTDDKRLCSISGTFVKDSIKK